MHKPQQFFSIARKYLQPNVNGQNQLCFKNDKEMEAVIQAARI